MISKTALLAPGRFASTLYKVETIYADADLVVSFPSQSGLGLKLGGVEDKKSNKQWFAHIVLHVV